MRFLWRSLLVVVALMGGSVLLVACGGGDGEELSLDQYFRQMEDIGETYHARGEALDEEASALGQDVEAIQGYFGDLQDNLSEALEDMKDLDPPSEAQDAHDEFVAALEEAQAALEDLGGRIADTESFSALVPLLGEMEGPEFGAAFKGIEDACLGLQGIADENSIDVDLPCEEGL